MLIAVLFLASVQTVFASPAVSVVQKSHSEHYTPEYTTVVSNADNLQAGKDNIFDSVMLCANSTCGHCVTALSVLLGTSDANPNTKSFLVLKSLAYLESPTKDRPPRNS